MTSLGGLLPLVCLILLADPGALSAYDLPAHRALTEKAAHPELSSFDKTLKDLGFSNGQDSIFLKRSAEHWLTEGGALEDKPDTRVVNHFHNPLAPSWATAGLSVGPFQGLSSVLWQQHPSQETAPGLYNGPGNWSWPSARGRYLEALSRPTKGEREAAFASLFRTLGQMMHLVQDSSLPAHVRNDQHLTLKIGSFVIYSDADGYEAWVDKTVKDAGAFEALFAKRRIIRPPDDIFALASVSPRIDRANAPAPVSALIDTGQYTGRNPDITRTPTAGGPLIGIAEYANANFFSNDTNSLLKDSVLTRLPYPAPSSLTQDCGPRASRPSEDRCYLKKTGDGDQIDRLAVTTALYTYLPDSLREAKIGLDDTVFEAYAEKLLPRAVGYSAALIDYFFRGKLEAKLDGDRLVIVNRTPGETMSGTFELYYDAIDDARVLIDTWPLTLAPGKSSDPLKVRPHPDGQPPPARPDSYTLVFSGTLGGEDGAIAARRFTRGELPRGWGAYLYSVSYDEAPPLTGTYLFPLSRLYYAQVWDWLSLASPIGGRERIGIVMPVYRNPRDIPGRRLTVYVWGGCEEYWRSPMLRPVRAHFVEFYEPADLEGLQKLDYEHRPPGIKRLIKSVELAFDRDFEGVLMTLDIGDVPFFGVRLDEYPTFYPPPSNFGTLNENRCEAGATILAIE